MKLSNNSGKSLDDAIIISDIMSHDEMIEAEYTYIKRKFKRYFLVGQELIPIPSPHKVERWYDCIMFRTFPFLWNRKIYFDITKGFELLKGEKFNEGNFDIECACGWKVVEGKLIDGTNCPKCGGKLFSNDKEESRK